MNPCSPTSLLISLYTSLTYCNGVTFRMYLVFFGKFYGHGEKHYFIKNIFGWGWFDIYIYLVKTVVEIEVEQKII